MLVERDGVRLRDAERVAEALRRALDEVRTGGGSERGGERAGDGEVVDVRRFDRHRVAVPREGEQRFELVIAVGAAVADVEGEVDLGGGGVVNRVVGDHRGGRPWAIRVARRDASPGSAVSAAARHA